jgi:Tfp pilus assembly protein PilE
MTDLHETDDPKYTAQIDTVGGTFVGFVVVIVAIAAMVAYHGYGTVIANTPLSHAVGSPG